MLVFSEGRNTDPRWGHLSFLHPDPLSSWNRIFNIVLFFESVFVIVVLVNEKPGIKDTYVGANAITLVDDCD